MRLFAISDLHVDYPENWDFVERLPARAHREDALIVAGDVGHRLRQIEAALGLLRERFAELFYVPGNHELWVGEGEGDSLEKFARILELCRRLGVRTEPGRVGEAWVVPLFSWYSEVFDEGENDDQGLAGWADFRRCRWPEGLGARARFFAQLNEDRIRSFPGAVVSFSHFLPRPELLPGAEHLRFRGLPRVSGSPAIEEQVRRLGAGVHVFGHSHIRRDVVLEGVRYVQQPLGYPRERRGREVALKQIYS